MSQLGQGSLRFPATRLLEADYGTVLARQVQDHDHVKRLESALFSNDKDVNPPTPATPHLSPWPPMQDGCGQSNFELLLRRVNYLKKDVALREQSILEAHPLVRALIGAARKDPASTAHVLSSRGACGPRISVARRRGKLSCAGRGKEACPLDPLPLSRFCLQHQCLDSTQVLYRSCCWMPGGSGQEPCGATVLDIFSNPPLCYKHTSLESNPRKKMALQHPSAAPGSKRISREMVGKLAAAGKSGSLGAVGKMKSGGVVKGGVIMKPGGSVKGGSVLLKGGGTGVKGVRKGQPGSLLHSKVISLVKLKSAEILAESKSSAMPATPTTPATPITSTLPATSNTTNPTIGSTKELSPTKATPTPAESVKPSATLDDLLTLSSSLTAPKLDLLPLKADIGDIMMAGEDSDEEGIN